MMHFQVALLDNHEEAARGEAEGFTPEAAIAVGWTQRELLKVQEDGEDPKERQRFLKSLPLTHEDGDFYFVHGSPRDPTREYVFPQDIVDSPKMWEIFRSIQRYCFMGHTHIPGIFTESFKFYRPKDLKENAWPLQERKILCNVGSVGQPRDDDWRACYVLLDDKTIRFRRVEYDMKTTIKKIKQVPELKRTLSYYKTS
jgi:diadenosine tetraphosphatase ApaH/serine/threonine PP2A family protein phosphatase